MNLLPKPGRLRVTVAASELRESDAAKLDHVVVLLPRRVSAVELAKLPFADAVEALRDRALDKYEILTGALPGDRPVGLTVASLPERATTFARLDLSRRVLASLRTHNPTSVAVVFGETPGEARDATAGALAAAAFAFAMGLPSFKSKKPRRSRLRSVRLTGKPNIDLKRLKIEGAANDMARWLTALPPNVLDARALIRCAGELADREGWEHTLYDELALREMGAEAFLAVARGNDHGNTGIVHLRREGSAAHVSLVGKGVCYDTGGINVKPANHMNGMQEDMQGSAVALASFFALSHLTSDLDLECWLAVTENRINGDAYTPNEIVSALNGKTIEVIHSDAEGRMALADALVLAAKNKPGLLIDYATLTGSCVSALTTRYSGVFTNRDELNMTLARAGYESGERVWPFPMDADFDGDLSSRQADIKQCVLSGGGDHILAARFLSLFVGDKVPWVHVDLSAGNHKGGLGHVPTDVTGFGVRFTTHLVLDTDATTN